MDVSRDFKSIPPREKLDNLGAIVRDFRWRFPRERRDMVVEYCKKAGDLKEAIDRACAARGEDGKMHNHQTRVAYAARDELAWSLKAIRDELHPALTFHQLLDKIREAGIPGIGPVTEYDVATRVGAFLGIEPEHVYLHAGVRRGWMALIEASMWPDERKAEYLAEARKADFIPSDRWPLEFRNEKPDDIEDMLCTYRDYIKARGRLSAIW